MNLEYRIKWKRDNRWRYRKVVKLSTAQRYAKWINSPQSLHYYCYNEDTGYGTAHIGTCLSEIQVPAVIQKRTVGEWDEALFD